MVRRTDGIRELPTRNLSGYIRAMGVAITMLCIASLLFVWDVRLKALQAVSRPAARRYLDRAVSRMAHRLATIVRCYGGLRVERDRRLVTDVPSPTLVVANHQSVADIVILLDAFSSHRIRFVAKAELKHGFPAVSEVLRIQQHAFVNRKGDFRKAAREMKRLGRLTREGISPVVFPEGTRSRTGQVNPFHGGGVRTILGEANVPLTAVAVDGGHRFVSVGDILKGLSDVTYRAKLVGVYTHDGTKQSILDALSRAQSAVSEQIESWRVHDRVHRGS
jgi:1-acyl-sn-glycerol-3-phosphate acyltransferase